MSQFLHDTDNNNDDAKTIKISRVKNKNFTKNFKSKKGHNSCKNEFRVIPLVCTYSPFYKNIYFEFYVYMFCNGRDMTKGHRFCPSTTMTMPRLHAIPQVFSEDSRAKNH